MKKITYTFLVLTGLFISSTVYALEARIPTTSITQALQIARNKDNFSTLKSAKFNVVKICPPPLDKVFFLIRVTFLRSEKVFTPPLILIASKTVGK